MKRRNSAPVSVCLISRRYASNPGWIWYNTQFDFRDAKGLLLDAFVEGTPGGTGQSFDWGLIPLDLPLPVILSGGLGSGQCAERPSNR